MTALRMILHAADDDDVGALVALVLSRVRRVTEAADGEGALALARLRRPDLAVLDVQMPGPDGIEVCRRLKAGPVTARMPVEILTPDGASDVREEALAVGLDAFVSQPFRPAELLAMVRRLCRRKRSAVAGSTRRVEDAAVISDDADGAIELVDRGMSVADRGYVCEARVTTATGTAFMVRVVAPERAAGHARIAAVTLGAAARRVARERAQRRLEERAFVDGEVYPYVVSNPFASPPSWRPISG
jgi:DNA-binding response OmpR family regulator